MRDISRSTSGSPPSRVKDSIRAGLRVVSSDRGVWSFVFDSTAVWRTAVLATVVLALGALALILGPIEISFAELGRVLFGQGSHSASLVVLEWRMPRILAALVLGGALGIAGALMQTITRNPLGSPDVIGFSAGSYFGALLVIFAFHGAALSQGVGAVIGGLAAAGAVWILAFRRGVSGFRLILVGIGVSSILTALSSWLVLLSSQSQYRSYVFWGAGSLDAVTWEGFTPLLIAVCIVIAFSHLLTGPLQQFELGDRIAASQGVRVEGIRGLSLIIAILLTALVTAAVGPIQFVALAAPHIAHRIRGRTGLGLVSCAFSGALLLLAADTLGSELLPVKLPVGVITLVFGGCYLTFLLFQETRHS